MKRLFLVTIAVGMLVAPHSSRAAMWTSIIVNPERPVAGERARITFEAMLIVGEGVTCRTDLEATVVPWVEAAEPGSTPLPDSVEVTAIGPELDGPDATPVSRFAIPKDAIVVTLLWSPNDSGWTGEIRFPRPGECTLRMTRSTWSGDPACIGHEITVTLLRDADAATHATATPAPTKLP